MGFCITNACKNFFNMNWNSFRSRFWCIKKLKEKQTLPAEIYLVLVNNNFPLVQPKMEHSYMLKIWPYARAQPKNPWMMWSPPTWHYLDIASLPRPLALLSLPLGQQQNTFNYELELAQEFIIISGLSWARDNFFRLRPWCTMGLVHYSGQLCLPDIFQCEQGLHRVSWIGISF